MKKKNIIKWGDYLLLFLLIAISGFPLFRDPIYILYYFIYLITYLIIRNKVSLLMIYDRKEILFLFLFIIISFLHFLLYQGFIFFSYLVLFAKIYAAFLILKYLKFNFIIYYTKIIKILCVISLFFWTLLQVFPLLIPLMFYLGVDVPYTSNEFDRTLIIYHLNPNSFLFSFVRNNGPFWEPGGFVLFIIIAVLFTFIQDNKINYKHIGIYIITLITTFSTAGYLALLVFILLNYILIQQKYIWSILLLIVSLYAYYEVDFLSEKIHKEITYTEQKGSQDFRSRYGSFDLDLKIFFASPIIGRGYSAERYDYKIYGILDEENSGSISSPTDFLARFGFVGFGVYIYFIFHSFSVLFKNYRKAFLCVIIYLIIGFSQSCYFLPFFMTIPFLYIIKSK